MLFCGFEATRCRRLLCHFLLGHVFLLFTLRIFGSRIIFSSDGEVHTCMSRRVQKAREELSSVLFPL